MEDPAGRRDGAQVLRRQRDLRDARVALDDLVRAPGLVSRRLILPDVAERLDRAERLAVPAGLSRGARPQPQPGGAVGWGLLRSPVDVRVDRADGIERLARLAATLEPRRH